MGLLGKTAIVTGASKGIGLAVTKALVAEGVHVVAGARTGNDELSELQAGGAVDFVSVDLSTAVGPIELVEAAARNTDIDILVNNVGAVTPRVNGFAGVTDEDWLTTITLGLMATVRTTRAALPHLLRRDSSAIVSVGSVNATLPYPNVIDYSATKAALANFCKALSKESAQKASG